MLALLLQQRLLLLLLLLPVLLLLQQQLRLPRVSFLPTPRKTVQHASSYRGGVAAYVSIRQHTSAYVSIRQQVGVRDRRVGKAVALGRYVQRCCCAHTATRVCGLKLLVYAALSY